MHHRNVADIAVCRQFPEIHFQPGNDGRIKTDTNNQWQELPEIQHPQVKLGAELDIFYKGWHQPITLPNNANAQQIKQYCKEEAMKYDSK